MKSEGNIMLVRDEDKEFIRDIVSLPSKKLSLVKGIVIGLQLQDDKYEESEGRNIK